MKRFLFLVLYIALFSSLLAQTENLTEAYLKQCFSDSALIQTSQLTALQDLDFSSCWSDTDKAQLLGFIGKDYQRIHIQFISVIKHPHNPLIYLVYGKSMVKNNVCEFQGQFKVEEIRTREGGKRGLIAGKYEWYENPAQSHVGQFAGVFVMDWTENAKGKISTSTKSQTISGGLGNWQAYGEQDGRPCHWGYNRIPQSGPLDQGTDSFLPNESYAAKGWENLLILAGKKKGNIKKVQKAEARQWWN